MATGRRRAADDRHPSQGRIRSDARRAWQPKRRSGDGPAAARHRGGRLRGHEHHAAVRLGLVGGRPRNPTGVPPDIRRAGAAHARLFRPHLLRFRLERPARRADEHGRADQRRRAAGVRAQRLRHGHGRTACLFRRRDLAAVLPAGRARGRSGDARAGAGSGHVPRADDAAWSHRADARRRAANTARRRRS